MGIVIPISDPSIPLATSIGSGDYFLIDQVDGTSITGYRTKKITTDALFGGGGLSRLTVATNSGFTSATIVAGSLSGTTPNNTFWNNWAINNDALVISTPGAQLCVLALTNFLSSGTAKGYRTVFQAKISQSVATATGSGSANFVGVAGISETASCEGGSGSNYWGGYFGANFWAGNNVAGGNAAIVTGAEFDNYGLASSTQNYKFGINIGDGNGATANKWDAAIAVYTLGAQTPYPNGRGWQQILSIGDIASSGLQPLSSTGTIFGTHLETITSVNCANGIDWSACVFSGAFLKSVGFLVDGSGKLSIGGQTGDSLHVSTSTSFDGIAINAKANQAVALKFQNNNTNMFWIGAALGSNQWITGTAVGDLVFRIDGVGSKTWWSQDAGTTGHMSLSASALNLASSVALQVGGTQVVGTRKTGWVVATGTPSRATFTTSGVTLATLAGVVMALEQDLISHGLIGT